MTADLIREATQAVNFKGPIGQYSKAGKSVRNLVRDLRDALERAEKERDALEIMHGGMTGMAGQFEADRDRLRAENERLREALAQIAVHDGGRWLPDLVHRQDLPQEIARAALAREE